MIPCNRDGGSSGEEGVGTGDALDMLARIHGGVGVSETGSGVFSLNQSKNDGGALLLEEDDADDAEKGENSSSGATRLGLGGTYPGAGPGSPTFAGGATGCAV